MTQWSPQQDAALKAVDHWYKNERKSKQVFRLFGCAGVGKTTLAKHFAEGIEGHVRFATFTGKAAHVMASKGCEGASTIHRMIYRPKLASKHHLKKLEKELEDHKKGDPVNKEVVSRIEKELKAERENAGRMSFSLNLESDLKHAKLLIIDECFVKGTLVNTPKGVKCIEDIRPGDAVLNALGVDKVVRISKKEAVDGVKIKCGEKEITCSQDHIFFTERGEVRARDLRLGERLTTYPEAMRLLQKGISYRRKRIQKTLLTELQYKLVEAISGNTCKNLYGGTQSKSWTWKEKISAIRFTRSTTANKNVCRYKASTNSRSGTKNKSNSQSSWFRLQRTWGKWTRSNQAAISIIQDTWGWLGNGTYRLYSISSKWNRLSNKLQIGYRKSRKDDLHRSGWQATPTPKSQKWRCEENEIPREPRVESVTFLELGHPELDRFRDADGKLYLYDLTAERHSSFAVEGILVHNCSMVSQQIGKDLESFGVPILVLGDPEQLPPIYGQGYFTEKEPDIMLDQIHRQALDNPIIAMSKLVREGKPLPLGQYGNSRVLDKKLDAQDVLDHDIILVGLRKTKKACDDKSRLLLQKLTPLPTIGDRVMCVKNNHTMGLLNGQIFDNLHPAIDMGGGMISLHIKNPDTEEEMSVCANEKLFYGQPISRWEHEEEVEEFEYSYAITVHKSQGSQWDNVLLFDQKDRFPNWSERDRRRWLYTGITRAAEKITVMRI